jgi:hypothetical protein
MEGPSDEPDRWTEVGTGRSFGGLPAIALAGGILLVKVLSLQWLWVRWKNKPEARNELQRLLREHEAHSYADWLSLVGHQKRMEFTTREGTWYQATIEAVWDDATGGAVRVLFAIDDGGWSSFFPMTDSLLVEPPDDAP